MAKKKDYQLMLTAVYLCRIHKAKDNFKWNIYQLFSWRYQIVLTLKMPKKCAIYIYSESCSFFFFMNCSAFVISGIHQICKNEMENLESSLVLLLPSSVAVFSFSPSFSSQSRITE